MSAQRVRRLTGGFSAVALLGWLLAGCSPHSSAHPAHARTWQLVWQDQFAGHAGAPLSAASWLHDTGTGYGCAGCPASWGTGEVETMSKRTANVSLDGRGRLAITPIRDANGTWTSGRIESKRTDFAAPAGGALAVEASIRMPSVTGMRAAGYWPAFWMLGSAFRGTYLNWPRIGEVDIMENVNGLNTDFGTLHCGTAPGGLCNEYNGLGGSTHCAPVTCQKGFHLYWVEIDRSTSAEQIRWYLDGREFWHVSANKMDASTWSNAVHHPFFIILDVALGGSFPDGLAGGTTPTASTVSGVPMLVDYVRVYSRRRAG